MQIRGSFFFNFRILGLYLPYIFNYGFFCGLSNKKKGRLDGPLTKPLLTEQQILFQSFLESLGDLERQ